MNIFRQLFLLSICWECFSFATYGRDSITSPEGFLCEIDCGKAKIIGYTALDRKNSICDTLHIPSKLLLNNKSYVVRSVGVQAFAAHTEIHHVVVDEGVEDLCHQAFAGCVNLESVLLPSSLIGLGDGMFEFCNQLERIEIDASNKYLSSPDHCNAIIRSDDSTLVVGCKSTAIPSDVVEIGQNAFEGCVGLEELTIPEGVRTIGTDAFSSCVNLKSIDLPNSLESIKNFAFYKCESLQSIEIPKNVKEVSPDYIFSGCSSLRKLTVNPENPYYDSREDCNGIVQKCDSTLIVACAFTSLPESITKIGAYSFHGIGIQELHINSKIMSIPAESFCGADRISSITVDSNNIMYTSPEGCNAILSKNGDSLILGCENTIIPPTVKFINGFSFFGRYRKSSLSLPDGLQSIGENAFAKCNDLFYLRLPVHVKALGWGAFQKCKNLSVVDLNDELKDINDRCFAGCTNLTAVKFGKKIKFIGDWAFEGCTKLAEVYIPTKHAEIRTSAFGSSMEY